ncbi:6130_t:CDS:2 [Diversispora eburnea]|uniref:Ubiquitin carboxyl-terminal hydrolase n=1 Tax=Diversispora eburnea TaxID=1213867 RepID=A0A9N8VSD5_9GLOM|nr:6130_t:CDS:2 [Diversispora eburnea]
MSGKGTIKPEPKIAAVTETDIKPLKLVGGQKQTKTTKASTNKKGLKRKAEPLETQPPAQVTMERRTRVIRVPKKNGCEHVTLSEESGCEHLKVYKKNNKDTYLDNFNIIAELSMHWYHIGLPAPQEGNPNGRSLCPQKCFVCKTREGKLHACIDCVFIGCHRINNRSHAIDHYHNEGHTFAVDVVRLDLFCYRCDDYIYDSAFRRSKIQQEVHASEKESNRKDPNSKRARYVSWVPTKEETEKIRKNSTLVPCSGLRGLYNMGATCFMNAVLQVFINNPIIKNYFMSDKHNKALCETAGCMCCEFDNLFQEFFSGETKPYPPCSFLHAMWLSSTELAGYNEQDAHEFYMAAINKMHSDSKEKTADDLNKIDIKCECIMHKTFGGLFQSRIKCKKCNRVSIIFEHLVEWQIHLRGNGIVKKKGGVNGGSKASNEVTETKNSLFDCLDRCTAEEQLEGYTCEKCHEQKNTKRISCRKLPPVLVFIVERFQRTTRTTSKTSKNEEEFEFPEEIDMAPWTSRAEEVLEAGGSLDDLPEYKYKLISVVNHEGKINTGHYTTYCKNRGQWFLFDDHAVKLANVEDVLQSKRKAYLCFYMAETIEYDQAQEMAIG